MDCFCGYRLVEVICIEQMLSVKQTKFASTFISLAAHSLNIHRGSGLGPRAFYPSLLWQQLSVCCPDLLFARGMVAICWRRLNLSVPVFRTDRYADVRACMCVCVRVFFLRSRAYTCSRKLLPFPPWSDPRIGSGTCVSQRGPLVSSLDWHISQHIAEKNRRRCGCLTAGV